MKFIFRWLFRLLILTIVLVVTLVLLKDVLLKALVEYRLREQTGLDVQIGRLEMGLLTPTLTIEDLKFYNPAEFGGSLFLDLPELHLEYDRPALAAGRLHLILVRVNLAEVHIVQGKSGQYNVSLLEAKLNPNGGPFIPPLKDRTVAPNTSAGQPTPPPKDRAASPNASTGQPAPPPQSHAVSTFRFEGIDTLNLSLGKVKFTCLPQPERSTEFKLGMNNEVITQVKSTADLNGLVLKILLQKSGLFVHPKPAPAKSPPPPAVEKPGTKPAPTLRGLAAPYK